MAKRAVVRPPGRSYHRCISSHPEHSKINLNLAIEQHQEYVSTLAELGLDIIMMKPLDHLPDACFVEDTVVIHGRKGLMTRPTPLSRREEGESVEDVLKDYLTIERVQSPGNLEGGDVIHVENHLISGITQRTNLDGVQQMQQALGVTVDTIEDLDIIHLKSYATYLRDNVLIGISRFSTHPAFKDYDFLTLPDSEAYASNTLTVNGTTIIPRGYPKTLEVLREIDLDVIQLDTSEFARCEGALTCLSIIF